MNPSYIAASKGVEESSNHDQSLRPQRVYRYWPKMSLSWFAGLLWLAPIIVLLYFNFTNYIIGPSASCPPEGCKADPLAASGSHWTQDLDYNDHNTLGGLQLVAKVLELWFLFIALNAVYNITTVLASSGDGLPIGLLSTPWVFAESRSLWEGFRAVFSRSALSTAKERPPMSRKVYFFVGFIAFMCVLVNLMGPAVAVLALPALRWVDLPKHAQHSFNISGIDRVLVSLEWGPRAFPNCTVEDIMDRRYSCTSLNYASSLDSWDDSVIASDRQEISLNSELQTPGISPEGDVFFTFNISARSNFSSSFDVVWVPNRQALREVSVDLDNFHDASQELESNPRYGAYNRSLNTVLKRRGPMLGAIANQYFPENITSIVLGHERELRCYGGYFDPSSDSDSEYTKCLRVGTAWNLTNKQARFKVMASGDDSLDHVNVSTFFSDKAAYYNETFNSDLNPSSCFVNGTVSTPETCTFDRFFQSQPPDVDLLFSFNILNVELSMPQKFPNRTIVFEISTYANFSTYTLDTSPLTNPMYLVQVDDIPKSEKSSLQSIPVDPDWLLTAWSVDNNGLVANRSASLSLIRGLEALFGPSSFVNVTSEDTDEEGTSPSVSESPLSFLPRSTTFTTAPINMSTAGVSSAETHSGSDAVTSVSMNVGMTRVASTFTSSAFDMGVKRQETPLTSATTTSDDVGLSPDDEESPLADFHQNISAVDSESQDINDLATFAFFSYLQALSMVPYSKMNFTSGTDVEKHPPLLYWARVHVWCYGTDSRTSKLGIVVTMLGAVCAIISTVIGMIWRRKKRSLTDLIVAALEHRQDGEAVRVGGEEQLTARTRYKLIDDGGEKHIRFTQ
ncbi:hypothetical protein G7Y79_00002g007300 [Physcia stellaris]|nr:hypothetical protein G7Y79_00002g007300 [Physcia stellaris]